MWVWRDSNGEVRQFKVNADAKRCPICGQYFRKNERGCAIVPPMEIRRNHKKLSQNLVAHYDEWEEFCKNVSTDEELAQKFSKHKTPHKKEYTEDEKKRIGAFRSACNAYRFYEEYEKPYGLKCKQRGSSLCLEYNVYADKIDINSRGKRGLFDGFFARQIVANIYNEMHKILGDGKLDEFNATKTIQSVVNDVNEMMENIN